VHVSLSCFIPQGAFSFDEIVMLQLTNTIAFPGVIVEYGLAAASK
jgi:hypothetical protein